MKMTDLKREHFPNGQNFSQKTLDDYIAARAQAYKDFFTRYLVSLAIGIAAGFVVLMLVPSGMLRIFLAMLCVMVAGLIATRLTSASLERFKEQSRKILLTKKDVRAAKKNLRNGTVAWGDKKIEA